MHLDGLGELFHTADGTAFADFIIGGQRGPGPSAAVDAGCGGQHYQASLVGRLRELGIVSDALNLLEATVPWAGAPRPFVRRPR
jgi:hypothetical protein